MKRSWERSLLDRRPTTLNGSNRRLMNMNLIQMILMMKSLQRIIILMILMILMMKTLSLELSHSNLIWMNLLLNLNMKELLITRRRVMESGLLRISLRMVKQSDICLQTVNHLFGRMNVTKKCIRTMMITTEKKVTKHIKKKQ